MTTCHLYRPNVASVQVGAVAMATNSKGFVVGVVCRSHLSSSPELIHMTPGLVAVA